MRLRLLSPAEKKLAEAAKYYEEQAAGLGRDFLDEVLKALKKIREFP